MLRRPGISRQRRLGQPLIIVGRLGDGRGQPAALGHVPDQANANGSADPAIRSEHHPWRELLDERRPSVARPGGAPSHGVNRIITKYFMDVSKSVVLACHPIEKRSGASIPRHRRCSNQEMNVHSLAVESSASRIPIWLWAAAALGIIWNVYGLYQFAGSFTPSGQAAMTRA